jgi:hypothetical protein
MSATTIDESRHRHRYPPTDSSDRRCVNPPPADCTRDWTRVGCGAIIVGVETFKDDDAGYLAWLAAHPDGFVLNTYRNPRSGYLRLHAASCRSISGIPANGARWTTTYVKRCGERGELEDFARRVVGGDVWVCPTCL